MKGLGVELELTGVKIGDVRIALENLFETVAEVCFNDKVDVPYSYYRITDKNSNKWLVLRDRSIKPQCFAYTIDEDIEIENRFTIVDLASDKYEYMVEVVTPVLTTKTLSSLFSVVDILKSMGGIVNNTCGIHVHIDIPDTDEDILSIFRRFVIDQENIFSRFAVNNNRLEKYCKMYKVDTLDFEDFEQFITYLRENCTERDEQGVIIEKSLRYYALNFYSIQTHNTIEWRLFNAVLDRVELAKILDWVIHFSYSDEDVREYISVLSPLLLMDGQE